jgi:hypothetical protein
MPEANEWTTEVNSGFILVWVDLIFLLSVLMNR